MNRSSDPEEYINIWEELVDDNIESLHVTGKRTLAVTVSQCINGVNNLYLAQQTHLYTDMSYQSPILFSLCKK